MGNNIADRLLIGGPADGERYNVHREQNDVRIEVLPPVNTGHPVISQIETHTYRSQVWRNGDTVSVFFVHESIPQYESLEVLIRGYRRSHRDAFTLTAKEMEAVHNRLNEANRVGDKDLAYVLYDAMDVIMNLDSRCHALSQEIADLKQERIQIMWAYDPNCEEYHFDEQLEAMKTARQDLEALQELAQGLGNDPEGCVSHSVDDALGRIQDLEAKLSARTASTRWFSYDAESDGLELHDSAREAKASAQRAMDAYAGDADEGWHEMSTSVCWGQVLQEVSIENQRELEPDEIQYSWVTWVEDHVLRDVEALEEENATLREVILKSQQAGELTVEKARDFLAGHGYKVTDDHE